jgi:hypothetical protein
MQDEVAMPRRPPHSVYRSRVRKVVDAKFQRSRSAVFWVYGPRILLPLRADHARRLAEATWQPDLEDMLRRLARDFDETAEDIEAGATEMRHPELLP